LGLLHGPYFDRANESAFRGRWAEAAEFHTKVLELDPSNSLFWHDEAVLRLKVGDVEGYRRVCRGMLARFGGSNSPVEAECIARTCCLAPGAVADYEPVLRLADRAVTGTENHQAYRWFLIARGMADYRAGRFAGAIDWLRKSLTPGADSEEPVRDGLAHAVLAMAHHRLGQAEEARKALDRARDLEERLPASGGNLTYNWLRVHVVRREADALLGAAGAAPEKK
jgi:Flp pilus assembly protein TadD